MLKKILKIVAQISFLLLAAFFAQTAKATVVPVWGQAYSPNIGWINFYCDGHSVAKPPEVNPTMGVSSVPNTCGSIAYATLFDTDTNLFSGVAYSYNYGWLNLSGVSLSGGNLQGSSGSNGMATYNFGTTYFQTNQPNNYNPGSSHTSATGKLCGFAYSSAVGYISLCDAGASYPLYSFNSYGSYLDNVAPQMTSLGDVFAADNAKVIALTFADGQAGLTSASASFRGEDNNAVTCSNPGGSNLAGVASWIATMTCDFSVAQKYDVTFTTCDVVGNCRTETIPEFYNVVAAAPAAAESGFEFGSPLKIADANEAHFVKVILKDKYKNPVISVTDIKEVKVNFNFDNTTKLDQIAGSGDSAVFASPEFNLNKEGGTATGFLREADYGDGQWKIYVKSYAPTSAGYAPIAEDGFDLNFENIVFEINPLNDYYNVGESAGGGSTADPERVFDFAPTIKTAPEAMNFEDDFVTASDAIDNITINAPKRFQIQFINESPNVDAKQPELGLLIDSKAINIAWGDAALETADTTPVSQTLALDTKEADGFNQSWNEIGDALPTIPKATTGEKKIRIRTTPILTPGTKSPTDLNTSVKIYVGYEVNGKVVRHKSEELKQTDDAEVKLRNPSLSIAGAVSSARGIFGKQEDTLSKSLGDLTLSEAKLTIDKNIKPFVNDPRNDENIDCKNDFVLAETSDFDAANCLFSDRTIVFVNKHDVYLDNPEGDITLPSGLKTILIKGGNLHIKSNLTYGDLEDSFGVILVKDAEGNGGNIYIYPNVTNVVGAFYSEGSIITVNKFGKSGEDNSNTCDGSKGFCDRSFELRNQLYWKGSIATANTIGGSDRNPFVCPSSIKCSSREQARFYDLTYFRTYHPNSGGSRANNINPTNKNAVTIEYDSRVRSSAPPLFESSATTGSSEANY